MAITKALMDALSAPADNDSLIAIREQASRVRDLQQEAGDLEERLADLNTQINVLTHETLPQMMEEAGIDRLDLPATGNLPAVGISLKPFYRANIAANWAIEKREAAFRYLESTGNGDLIKVSVDVKFNREDYDKAIALSAALEAQGLHPDTKRNVHPGTLTAWLKQEVERGKVPPLEMIGGQVGQIVEIKPRKA